MIFGVGKVILNMKFSEQKQTAHILNIMIGVKVLQVELRKDLLIGNGIMSYNYLMVKNHLLLLIYTFNQIRFAIS